MSETTIHAFTDDVLAKHDGVAIAKLIREREISASEAVEAAVERCKKANPVLGAVAEEDFERAQAKASGGDAASDSYFHGVPTFIKDQLPVEGLTTRFGSHALDKAAPAKKNSGFVAQMLDMGFINLGTSTLPEFGFTASTEFPDTPPTRNPWNIEKSAGGSSGGTAALVAAGVIPIAHGADGGGSIRIPSASCGLVGLKASRGRIIEEPVGKVLPVNIVVDGVLTRTVRDTARYFAEAEKRHRNPKLAPIGNVEHPIDRKLRVGVFKDSPACDSIDAATQKTLDETVSMLESLGHDVRPVALGIDQQFVDDFTHYWAMLGYLIYNLGKYIVEPSFDKNAMTDLTKGLAATFAEKKLFTIGAIRRLRKTAVDSKAVFNDVDVVLSPTVSSLPPDLGFLGMDLSYDVLFPRVAKWSAFTPYCNATGLPSISLPIGHHQESNLPVGMMFAAALGQERLLLELSLQLEEAKPFQKIWE